MQEQKWSIGVDLGGTKLEAAAIDPEGKILERIRIPTQSERGPDAIIADMASTIQSLIQKQPSIPQGIGIGTAGQINETSGAIAFSPNLPNWHNVPLKEQLQKHLDFPIFIINDVRAATWGEWLFGAGKDAKDFVCLFIGTGIGSGVVSGGRMLSGATNTFGELGHMIIDYKGLPCNCGNYGCLETLGAGWGVAARTKKSVQENPSEGKTLLRLAEGELQKLSAAHLIQAANENDPLAKKILSETLEALAAGCITIVNALNPHRLIIGGGFGQALPHLIPTMEQEIKKRALTAASRNLQVVPAMLGNDAGVIGAAAMTQNQSK